MLSTVPRGLEVHGGASAPIPIRRHLRSRLPEVLTPDPMYGVPESD